MGVPRTTLSADIERMFLSMGCTFGAVAYYVYTDARHGEAFGRINSIVGGSADRIRVDTNFVVGHPTVA